MLSGFGSPAKSSNASTPTRMRTRSVLRSSQNGSPLVPRAFSFHDSDFETQRPVDFIDGMLTFLFVANTYYIRFSTSASTASNCRRE